MASWFSSMWYFWMWPSFFALFSVRNPRSSYEERGFLTEFSFQKLEHTLHDGYSHPIKDHLHTMVKILRNQVFIGIAEENADFQWLKRAMKHLVDEYLLSMQVLVPLYHASNMAKHENILAEMREEALKNGMPDE